jgi:hypothetical protein
LRGGSESARRNALRLSAGGVGGEGAGIAQGITNGQRPRADRAGTLLPHHRAGHQTLLALGH